MTKPTNPRDSSGGISVVLVPPQYETKEERAAALASVKAGIMALARLLGRLDAEEDIKAALIS